MEKQITINKTTNVLQNKKVVQTIKKPTHDLQFIYLKTSYSKNMGVTLSKKKTFQNKMHISSK